MDRVADVVMWVILLGDFGFTNLFWSLRASPMVHVKAKYSL